MFKKVLFSAVVLAASFATAKGQACETPTTLCGGVTEEVGTFEYFDFTGLGIDTCLSGEMYTVVRFHTSFYETSEGAVVNISNVVCQGEVDAIVVQASHRFCGCNFTH